MEDLESGQPQGISWLRNRSVQSFSWSDASVTVYDRQKREQVTLIEQISGIAMKGEVIALMGPSGCGKTTLLNVLARRAASFASTGGVCSVNGAEVDDKVFRRMISYVEQDDSLIGSLTVEETLAFAAKLSLPSSISEKEQADRVRFVMASLGLGGLSGRLVGTPIKEGLSGGQKRRLSIASSIVACPRILFLDEPTSGLDSKTSFEVMNHIKNVAKSEDLIVIASIHQPSTKTFQLFDKLLLLSGGRTCYFGPIANLYSYFERATVHPIPNHINPAEFLLDLVNIDFMIAGEDDAISRLKAIWIAWSESPEAHSLRQILHTTEKNSCSKSLEAKFETRGRPNGAMITLILLRRLLVKSLRDVIAYGIRIAMYLCLAVLMGTVWLRLRPSQESIQPFINAIFFGSAFMSFMAVAYVPAYIEDRATFVRERGNGLYGATPFMVSNFLVGLPFLFMTSLLFSVVSYWLSNFAPSAEAFFAWVMWLFLDLVAAESLVVFVTSVFPNFVISLALIAFANALWFCVGGFLVPPMTLNPFWRYVFHYIDYQAYVFQGMMVNEFSRRVYSCGDGCQCIYQTDLASQCQIRGTGILQIYGYATGRTGKWVGILIGISAVYRLFGWIALQLRIK